VYRRSFLNAAFQVAIVFLISLSLVSISEGETSGVSYHSIDSYKLTVLNDQLESPWGFAFLPDKRIIVTQKMGGMVVLSPDGREIVSRISGLPDVYVNSQGGLLDVAIDPDFCASPYLYWSYTELGRGSESGLSGTAVAKGRLWGRTLSDVKVIYRQHPKVPSSIHYGSRIKFRSDKTLYVTLGDRGYKGGLYAQDIQSSLGKVIRINRDGSIPDDNPEINGKISEIYSYGHRNPQGADLHPETGELWISEHGPQGGDEINAVVPGENFGWPHVSYGCNYGDPVGRECRIGEGVHAPKYVEPVSVWEPISTAPAGMVFYAGSIFREWQGDLFMGALAGRGLWRIRLEGGREIGREKLFSGLNERIWDVEEGLEGLLYMITDSGKLIRISR